ncbi:hypothetical protein C7378_0808 [Acidipila rosea]|uniref:Uncharacterized protein n=1 Tax=Acidipila rosea TaxID=768535 RepID=A0A4R1LCA1_9BACT|nr:hypothetical protein C7378_0808 [Acidipila rosea]
MKRAKHFMTTVTGMKVFSSKGLTSKARRSVQGQDRCFLLQ